MSSRSTRIERSALAPFSPREMFDLVADIESYPRFLPWCAGVQVHFRDHEMVEATLQMARGPLRKSVTTRNLMHAPHSIEVSLLHGPFRRLHGCWRFEEVSAAGTRVSLDMEFEMDSALLRRTLGPVFGQLANTMVDAFCSRARDVYGTGAP